jgi:hypothetical protein
VDNLDEKGRKLIKKLTIQVKKMKIDPEIDNSGKRG